MQVSTLVEPIAGRGFRARAGSPFDITVEAESRQEAIQQLQDSLRRRLAQGAEIVTVEADVDVHSWQKFAGGLKDHPLLDDWKKAMEDYRHTVDHEESRQANNVPRKTERHDPANKDRAGAAIADEIEKHLRSHPPATERVRRLEKLAVETRKE